MSQRWASPMDWAGRRDVITRLYMDEHLPLPRVMDVMERDYGFYATARMYKDRFRRWKLFKYNVPSASDALQSTTRGSAPGKEVATKRNSPQSSVKEGNEETHGEKTVQTAAAPVVLSRSLKSPRIFLLPETVVCLSQQFFDCQIQKHHCYRFDESKEWWWTVESAIRLVEANRLQEGFRELNQGFDLFTSMLKDPEIGLLSNFYHMVIRLGPQLGAQLLDFATRMAMIKLGRRHPLTLVFDTLRRAGPQEVRDGGYLTLRAHFQAADRALGGTDAKIARHSAFILQALDWHHVDSSLPADGATIEVEMWRSYERLWAAGLTQDALDTLAEIAMMCVRYQRYDEAKHLADQIAGCARGCADLDARYFEGRAWRVRYLIARETDDMDECYLYGEKHLVSNCQTFGPEHHRPKAIMAQIQAHFREKGRPELAVKLEQEIAELEQGRALPEAHEVEFKKEIVEEEEEA